MKLTEADIKEFQTIIQSDYGVDLSHDKAYKEAYKLIQLMGIVLELDDQEGGAAGMR